MTMSLPIAANRVAITGCVAGQANMTGMDKDILRLSFVSLLPKPAHGPRFGAHRTRFAIARTTAQAARCQRQDLADRDAWRRDDGRVMMAGYHLLMVKPSQENPKSKAFASA
jgi:hypothetical protein